MNKYSTLIALLLITILCGSVHAQSGLGGIEGFIYDAEGKVIPEATLMITSPAMMGQKSTVSSKFGYYRFINLQPGSYTLKVSKASYQAQEISNISVRAGKTSSFNVTLEVGEFTETLIIMHESPLIDLKSPARGINVDGEFMKRLPLTPNRDWRTAWSMVPGVISDADFRFSNESVIENVRVHGYRIETNMMRSGQNSYNIDGMSALGSENGKTMLQISMDVIDDIQIVTSGFDASTPAGQGGYINVVTKSGGNDLSGSATFILQPSVWNDTNVEDGTPADLAMYQTSLALGGPIMKDRTWFFANYRYDWREEGISRTASARELWEAVDLPMPTFDKEARKNQFMGKVTHRLGDDHKLVGDIFHNRTFDIGGSYAYNLDAATILYRQATTYRFSVDSYWTEDLMTTLQASYIDGWHGTPESYRTDGPKVLRFGEYTIWNDRIYYGHSSVTYSGGQGIWEEVEDRRAQFRGSANYYVEDLFGSHDFKLGFDYTPLVKGTKYNHYATPHQLIQLKANGQWVNYIESTIDAEVHKEESQKVQSFAAYLQDNWQVSDRLSVSFGLRLERQWDELEEFADMTYSPNLGFSYSLTSDNANVIRASVGRKNYLLNANMFYMRSAEDYGFPSFGSYIDRDLDGNYDEYSGAGATDPGEIIPGVYLFRNISKRVYDPDIAHPSTDHFNISYTRIMPLNIQLDAAYHYQIQRNELQYYNDSFLWVDGEFRGYKATERPYTNYFVSNDKWSSHHYQSFELTATKNFSDNWQLIASYTWQDGTRKGEWAPYDWERYAYPADWFEYTHTAGSPQHLRIAASAILPFDITGNFNFVWKAGNWASAYKFARYTPDVERYFYMDDGTRVENPIHRFGSRWSRLAQPRSAERERFDGNTVFNVGLGKNFEIRNYRFEAQLQVFNIFNSGADVLPHNYMNYRNADLSPYYEQNRFPLIQSPRVMQIMTKFVF